jgi:hypothetical protein
VLPRERAAAVTLRSCTAYPDPHCGGSEERTGGYAAGSSSTTV